MIELLSSIIGTAFIVVVLRDVMHELFHPEAVGTLSRWIMHGVWRVLRVFGRRRRGAILMAGPTILVSVMLVWSILLLAGWTLIYWSRLPSGFNPSPSLPISATRGFLTALYVSLASMTTLSASDLTPKTSGLRMVLALESFVGPVIFTAWITWVLSIYPVLADRRAFTREVDIIRRIAAEPKELLAQLPRETAAELLRSLTEQVLRISAHIEQSRVTYYFQNEAHEIALAWVIPFLYDIAQTAEGGHESPAVRYNGHLLRAGIEQLLHDLGAQYLDLEKGAPRQVIVALARDHLLPEPPGLDRLPG
jgi:hypothetical protein